MLVIRQIKPKSILLLKFYINPCIWFSIQFHIFFSWDVICNFGYSWLYIYILVALAIFFLIQVCIYCIGPNLVQMYTLYDPKDLNTKSMILCVLCPESFEIVSNEHCGKNLHNYLLNLLENNFSLGWYQYQC